MAQINFKINGQPTTMNVDPDMPLLWALRDELGLTGTKYSCGEGLCGCCTVHLNGEAVRSCVTSVKEAEGREILTIEGLGQNGYHPLQQAWIEEEVPQCGYCQPGQIMIAAAMLEKILSPTIWILIVKCVRRYAGVEPINGFARRFIGPRRWR